MKYVTLFILFLTLSSCVSMKKYAEQKDLAEKTLAEKNDCTDKLSELEVLKKSLIEENLLLQSKVSNLANDSALCNRVNATLKKEIENLQSQIQILNDRENDILTLSSKEKQEALQELLNKQKDLSQKENKLLKLSEEIMDKDRRLRELEKQLSAKDSVLLSIKEKLREALSGFTSNELSISEKNGKLYLSFSDKILFNSGSFILDAKGSNALKKVSEVLRIQKGIEIIVEGHTDNVPYVSSNGIIKDNWDLSVLRATTVCKTMILNGIDPKKIIASGHAEYNPVSENNSDESKAKNRRTEIILSPDMKEIFNLLNKGL